MLPWGQSGACARRARVPLVYPNAVRDHGIWEREGLSHIIRTLALGYTSPLLAWLLQMRRRSKRLEVKALLIAQHDHRLTYGSVCVRFSFRLQKSSFCFI
jgi:hypothetical protein